MGKKSLLEDKRDEILRVAREHGALSVRVFGSYARGQANPDSDVDLIVELGPGRSLLDLIAIKQEIEDFIHIKVDVVTEASLSPYIRNEILQEAVSI
ncbi:MAG: nucleotidyltransferase family protein [Proteobacteria bacterium]|nr:nucleotidyltransferase family protein [Pseudomonadota bacterium]MBU1739549.1 nucleotidyltransferase family protein [Pseudomonadota bacterium]